MCLQLPPQCGMPLSPLTSSLLQSITSPAETGANALSHRYLDTMERALAAGELVLIENLEESMDPVLGPLLGRETIKKGR